MNKILVVDDEVKACNLLSRALESKGHDVLKSYSGIHALETVEKEKPDIMILDLNMPDMDGMDVLKAAKEIRPEILVIIYTAYGDLKSAIDAIRLNASDYVLKSVNLEELHNRVLHCTEKLELHRKIKLTNDELKQFVYVATHDMKEPLRMISFYTDMLQRRYKDKLNEEAHEFINYANKGATRLRCLLDDMSSYIYCDTEARPSEMTDCSYILDTVTDNLQVVLKESGAIITHDALPSVLAEKTQLVQLFQNIISNAVKFCNKDTTPCIHVSARQAEGKWVFFIRDNGIGIEQEYAEKVFDVFQRLHNRDEYPGSGIGLAICKKIVERLDGKIWIESEPGKGTTFYFSIPITKGKHLRNDFQETNE